MMPGLLDIGRASRGLLPHFKILNDTRVWLDVFPTSWSGLSFSQTAVQNALWLTIGRVAPASAEVEYCDA
jgi:hypothetical protein